MRLFINFTNEFIWFGTHWIENNGQVKSYIFATGVSMLERAT